MREYKKENSIVFSKTREPFGEFSNMCSGFELIINGIELQSSEVLYQALKFSSHPEIQEEIINTKNSMMAKKVAYKYPELMDPNWDKIKVKIMKMCLHIKHMQHFEILQPIFKISNGMNIVEYSKTDRFWGCTYSQDTSTYIGTNALGRLLMELRVISISAKEIHFVPLYNFPELYLLGESIGKKINKDGSTSEHV